MVGDAVVELLAEVQKAVRNGSKNSADDDDLDDDSLTAHAVAKRWSRWIAYVTAGGSEASCIGRIDTLIQEIRAQFELARLVKGGIAEGFVTSALSGVASLLASVIRGGADPAAVGPALAAFGRQLTTAQRLESHSMDSAAALAAAMHEGTEMEPDVKRAMASLPPTLKMPRWQAARRATRWNRGTPIGGGRQARGGAAGRWPRGIKRSRSWEDGGRVFDAGGSPRDGVQRGGGGEHSGSKSGAPAKGGNGGGGGSRP